MALGKAGFHLRGAGGGVNRAPLLDPPPKRAPLPPPPPPPQILLRLTPGPQRWPGPKIRQKKKMGFLESARREGSENTSPAMYLVGGNN